MTKEELRKLFLGPLVDFETEEEKQNYLAAMEEWFKKKDQEDEC